MRTIRPEPSRVRAFTLVETLVVAAIMAVLVAVLVPALAEAKAKSRVISCLSNQRQMAYAWGMYCNDHRTFPQNGQEGTYWSTPFGQPYLYGGAQAWMTVGPWPDAYRVAGTATTSQYSGMGMVYSYAPNPRTYFCPGNPSSGTWYSKYWRGDIAPGDPDEYWGFERQGRGAMMTYFYRSSMYYAESSPYAVTAIDFTYSANTVKRFDEAGVANKVMLTDFWDCWLVDEDIDLNPETLPHGRNFTNIVSTDGHAKTWKLPDRILPLWGFWDAQYTEAGFDSTGWTNQIPWWWVEADKAIR